MVDISDARRLAKSVSATGARAKALSGNGMGERRLTVAGLALLVLLAVGLRLVPIIVEPSINWRDEVFQSTEQAHRLVYGYGLVPWQFQLGMRSRLLPGLQDPRRAARRRLHDTTDGADAFPRSDPRSRIAFRAAAIPAGGHRPERCTLNPLEHRR